MPTDKEPNTARSHISADERRELLGNAALRVMKRDGIAAATTRAITSEAAMPHGAFHYCFHSKRELFAHLLTTDNNPALESTWLESATYSDDQLNFQTLFQAYWNHIETDPELQLVLNEVSSYALRDTKLHDLPRREHQEYIDKVQHYLLDFARRTNTDYTIEPLLLAELMVAALGGTMEAWLSHRDSAIARATLDQFADLFESYTKSRSSHK